MNLVQELERLAKLRAEGALTADEFDKAKSQLLSTPPGSGSGSVSGWPVQGVRRQSARRLFGLPLWAIAFGPDWEHGERRGHARGIFALGDIATGWFACGGVARGLFAFGGLALGLFAFGGASLGLLMAVGGSAIGTIAIGGGAFGYYAVGGGTIGVHTVSGLHQDPAALEFFGQYFPWLTKLLHR